MIIADRVSMSCMPRCLFTNRIAGHVRHGSYFSFSRPSSFEICSCFFSVRFGRINNKQAERNKPLFP
jgi:hypothetical protein